jgi:hypothetical protein
MAKERQTAQKSKETTVLLKNLQSEIAWLEGNKAKLEGDVQRIASIVRSKDLVVPTVPAG